MLGKKLLTVFGEIYDEGLFTYPNLDLNKNYTTKEYIDIKCYKHGIFSRTINSHKKKRKCRKCSNEENKWDNNKYLSELFKKNKEFKDLYKYDKLNYQGYHKKIKIYCNKHGYFEQIANNHLNGMGCNECSIDKHRNKKSNKKKYTVDELLNDENLNTQQKSNIVRCHFNNKDKNEYYIKKSKMVHGNKYIYDKFNYINKKNKVKIYCHKHGYFEQRIEEHINKKMGCPSCGMIVSKNEEMLNNDLKHFNFNIIRNDRKILDKKEIDILIPEEKIAIEINGNYWHSNLVMDELKAKRHLYKKFKMSKVKDYHLINFYEDDFIYKYNLILKEIFLLTDKLKLYNFKKDYLKIESLDNQKFIDFYNNNSLYNINNNYRSAYAIKYKEFIIGAFSLNEDNVCYNYCINYNNNEDLSLIKELFPNIVFKVKIDSFNSYKFLNNELLIINYESPKFYNFQLTGKDRLKRKIINNSDNRIYDCGSYSFIF
ncbi:hypothetical protein UFVDC4_00070 [Staphylococcus phage vB_SauM-UFV_DC4]|nr:hypothetical protein UFVDC4_00070 [Staphylococcus phage vB_SauM-UFV_DC4]